MEISRDVWRWLVSVQAVASVRASKQTTSDPNVVRVDQQTQAAMEVRALSINPKGNVPTFQKRGFRYWSVWSCWGTRSLTIPFDVCLLLFYFSFCALCFFLPCLFLSLRGTRVLCVLKPSPPHHRPTYRVVLPSRKPGVQLIVGTPNIWMRSKTTRRRPWHDCPIGICWKKPCAMDWALRWTAMKKQ